MFTAPMVHLTAVVLARDARALAEMLLQEGVVQLSASLKAGAVPDREVFEEHADLRKRLEGLAKPAGIDFDPPDERDVSNHAPLDRTEANRTIARIEAEREKVRERQRKVGQELNRIEELQQHLHLFGSEAEKIARQKRSLVEVKIGSVPRKLYNQVHTELAHFPAVLIRLSEDKTAVNALVVYMKRDRDAIGDALTRATWTDAQTDQQAASYAKEISADIESRKVRLLSEQDQLQVSDRKVITDAADELQRIWRCARVTELLHKVSTHFQPSTRTTAIHGWVPAEKQDRLAGKIRETTQGNCYLEWHSAVEGLQSQAPVLLKNPKLFKPFQMLVANFGTPAYGSVDPTIFVMPAYLIMFGLMFADAGQGLVLLIAGVAGTIVLKSKGEAVVNLSALLAWCGSASIVFGILFGSYFGVDLLPPLWFDFHSVVLGHADRYAAVDDIFDILAITIYFGITVIALGLLANWINLAKTRNFEELVLSKGGLLGGWIYAGGIYAAMYLIRTSYKSFPPMSTLFWIQILPALLIFAKGPLHAMRNDSQRKTLLSPMSLLNYGLEWAVELLEIFSGYLSNTLSFMRVAGLGIAHVSLMVAFFSMADMTTGIFSVLILIFGNILVIGIEGLSAGIQALRLNYYEFFTKFFHGTGTLYSPISLSSKD
ncbi:MAG: ATPase V [Chitinivibrionales bacterium]|nr:ATPase V [Chitinivibrionales bacterium]